MNAHSLHRYNDLRFYGLDTRLFRNGAAIFDGFDGSRLSFVRMAPTQNTDVRQTQVPDHLFVAGGGVLKKVDAAGHVTNWGIEPPPDGFTINFQNPNFLTIDQFEVASTWTAASASLADETVIVVSGKSMKMSVAANLEGKATKPHTLDFTQLDGVLSGDADVISVWIRIDHPENIDQVGIDFDISDGTFSHDMFARTCLVTDVQLPRKQPGTASLDSIVDAQSTFVESSNVLSPTESDNIVSQLAPMDVPITDVWINLRIPKLAFIRSGFDETLGWNNIHAVRLRIKTNSRGPVVVYWDSMELQGGAGLQGRYRYYVTYTNDRTGSRSNPNPNFVEIEDVRREALKLSNLPQPTDPQVTHIEIWRTLGDGSFYFFVDKVPVGVTGYVDVVADFTGLGSSTDSVLSNTQLTFDNIKPSDMFEFACGPHRGSMWWCGDLEEGKGGRVYYSPPGRAEGVKSYIECTSADDQTQCLVMWNGSMYCFAESGIFEILGTQEPFVPRRITGCPGTTKPFSVVRTPAGIAYEAHDGVRMFNGNISLLLYFDAVNKIMRRETVEGIAGFVPEFATYGRDEVMFGDGVVTLACNLTNGRWRELGISANALYYEDDTGEVMAAFNDDVLALEHPASVDDDGAGIAFDVKTPEVLLDPNQIVRIGMIVVDADTRGQQLTAYLSIDRVETVLGLVQTNAQSKVELPADRSGRRASVRLEGSLHDIVEIFHIQATLAGGIVTTDITTAKQSRSSRMSDVSLFDPATEYKGLWSGWSGSVMPRFGLLRAKATHQINTQTIRSRTGSADLPDVEISAFSDPGIFCDTGQFVTVTIDTANGVMFGGPAVYFTKHPNGNVTGYAIVYDSVAHRLSFMRWINTEVHGGIILQTLDTTLNQGDTLRILAVGPAKFQINVNNVEVMTVEATPDLIVPVARVGWVDLNARAFEPRGFINVASGCLYAQGLIGRAILFEGVSTLPNAVDAEVPPPPANDGGPQDNEGEFDGFDSPGDGDSTDDDDGDDDGDDDE